MATLYNFIRETLPSHNATAISVGSSVSVVFLSPMQAATLNSTTIILSKANGPVVAADYSYDFISQAISINPTADLEGNTQYQLKILSGETGPKTINGDTSSREYAISFTTEVLIPEEPPIEEPPAEEPPVVEPPVEVPTLFLTEHYPQNGTLVPASDKLVLRFNEAIDMTSLLAGTTLTKDNGSSLFALIGNDTVHTLTFSSQNTADHTVVLSIAPALANGTAYKVALSADVAAASGSKLNETVSFSFQTEWLHYFTSVRSVRLLMGQFGEAYSDQEIAEMINENSVGVFQLMSMRPDFFEDDWDPAPYAAKQYVLYRTAYTAMLNQALESSSGIKKNFQLGDLQVSESTSVSSEISNLLGLFEKEMDKWWTHLYGADEEAVDDGIYKPVLSKTLGSATKSETDYAYPTFLTRASFAELGG